jgi:hypothetical protein
MGNLGCSNRFALEGLRHGQRLEDVQATSGRRHRSMLVHCMHPVSDQLRCWFATDCGAAVHDINPVIHNMYICRTPQTNKTSRIATCATKRPRKRSQKVGKPLAMKNRIKCCLRRTCVSIKRNLRGNNTSYACKTNFKSHVCTLVLHQGSSAILRWTANVWCRECSAMAHRRIRRAMLQNIMNLGISASALQKSRTCSRDDRGIGSHPKKQQTQD